MSKRWRIAGSVVLVGLLGWRLDWSQLRQAFSGLDLRFWGLATLVYVTAQLASSARWQMLSAPLGFQATRLQYLSFYFIGMFFNLLLPTSVGGDVVRGMYLAAGQKSRSGSRQAWPPGRGEAMLSVFADRASGLAVMVAMACVAGLLAPTGLPDPPEAPGFHAWMIATLAVLGGCMVVGLAALPALPLFTRLPVIGRRFGQLVDAGRTYLHRPGLLLAAMLMSIVVQLAGVLQIWLISEGLGLNVSFGYLAVVVPLVSLLTLAPVSLNGMGLRELGMVVLLGPVGVAKAAAVMLSLLWFSCSAAVSLIGGGLYLFGRYPRYSLAREGLSDAEPVRGGSDQGRMRQPPAAA